MRVASDFDELVNWIPCPEIRIAVGIVGLIVMCPFLMLAFMGE